MGAVTQPIGARTLVNVPNFATLPSGAYCVSDVITPNAASPLIKPPGLVLDVAAGTVNTPSGMKRVVVFVQESVDGVNFRKGPTGGSDPTDEVKLRQVGILELGSDGDNRATFSVGRVLGYIPHSLKVVLKNEAGSALALGTLHYVEIGVSVA